MKIDEVGNRICSSQICGVQMSSPIIMKFCMQKLKTKIFRNLFSEIDLSGQKQRYVDSLCCNSLETPCIVSVNSSQDEIDKINEINKVNEHQFSEKTSLCAFQFSRLMVICKLTRYFKLSLSTYFVINQTDRHFSY